MACDWFLVGCVIWWFLLFLPVRQFWLSESRYPGFEEKEDMRLLLQRVSGWGNCVFLFS